MPASGDARRGIRRRNEERLRSRRAQGGGKFPAAEAWDIPDVLHERTMGELQGRKQKGARPLAARRCSAGPKALLASTRPTNHPRTSTRFTGCATFIVRLRKAPDR